MRVGLVGCVKSKKDRPTAARDLYKSPLFAGRRRWVEASCDTWFILSAKYGLVDPSTTLAPYDVTLADVSARDRRRWSSAVLASLAQALGRLRGHTFEIHAGDAYADAGLSDGLKRAGATVTRPAAGLSLGQQLQFYASGQPTSPGLAHPVAAQRARPVGPVASVRPGGKYARLTTYLTQSPTPTTVALAEIDELVGGLPDSAYRWRAWWANDASHSQARAWLASGRRVLQVDYARSTVTFG
jgi:hypothetical protein